MVVKATNVALAFSERKVSIVKLLNKQLKLLQRGEAWF